MENFLAVGPAMDVEVDRRPDRGQPQQQEQRVQDPDHRVAYAKH